ncbi:MAG TPA: SAM-dependent methyltransferase [Flavobacteriaceae bacterium]|nr:SAM-dependent methyltransferase [Flavobacteriaceae bacterium]
MTSLKSNLNSTSGVLYLIPTTLGETNPLEVLPISVKKIIEETDIYIVENEKSARRFIKSICPGKSQPKLRFYHLNKYTNSIELPEYLEPCIQGQNVGILSEAGCPGIADPGAEVVKLAHNKNIKVIPLVGPSAVLLAMMASGMNGQSFAFNGYLPIEKSDRKKEIKRLEKLSFDQKQSQSFIETPYRNNAILEDLLQSLAPQTQLCIACDITLSSEFIVTKRVAEWKKSQVDLHKRPTIFIIHKN